MEKPSKPSGVRAGIVSFFQTRAGHAILGVVALALAYVFGSWALDTGGLLDYAITFILLIIAVREFAALLGQIRHKKS